MTHTQRIRNILEGKPADRPAYIAWGPHANLEDRHIGDFVKHTINYQEYHDFDIIKVMPNGLYHTEDYGQLVRWGEDIEDASYKNTIQYALNTLEDWKKVKSPDIKKGAWAREIEVVRRVNDHFKGDVPVLATVFGPANTAINISKVLQGKTNEFYAAHEKEYQSLMEVVTENNIKLMEGFLQAGAAGFFYAQWGANLNRFSPAEYERYVKPYDLAALNAVKDKFWFTMLHVCGERIYMDKVLDYPVQALNWEDLSPLNPSLKQVRAMTDKVLMGGLDRNRDFLGSDREKIKDIIRDRIAIGIRDAGQKYIVAGGCEWNRNAAHRFTVLTEVIEELGAKHHG
ncbi:hypothetical protein FACS1894110_14830 [Spirochaetia bacterium]|nr:hypothetical protein FACS1894110_14830 [Spirochaetia bacterium]